VRPYQVDADVAITPLDDHTFEFGGGTVPEGSTTQDYPIQATDLLGDSATGTITVYAAGPLVLAVQDLTLVAGDSWTFTVTGGLPPYTWSLEDVPQEPVPDDDNSYVFQAVSQGTFTLSVRDSIGMSRAAIVQVEPIPPADASLQITPTAATVLVGGTVIFTALGGKITLAGGYTFSATGGTITPGSDADGSPATYVADAKGSFAVSVADDSSVAEAPVTVVTSPVQSLQLLPESPTVSAVGQTIEFTATGGTVPYEFSSDHPTWGSIVATGPSTALYAQEPAGEGRNVLVRVTDANATSISTMVFWK
jgi:hypothetical protein